MASSLLDKFTIHLKNVLKAAAQLATSLQHEQLGAEHLLFGLATQKGSIGTEILTKAGLTAEALKEHVIQKNRVVLSTSGVNRKHEPVFSESAKHAVERAVLIANQYDHKYVGTEHLLAGLLRLDDTNVNEILHAHRVGAHDLQQHLSVVLKNTSKFPDLTNLFEQSHEVDAEEMIGVGPVRTKERGNALDFFCTDLTDARLQETIDPVIGREKEIERLIHILSRRTKNNPVLIGDPGVGKTALVEGLAKRILLGNVPEVLATKRILNLDLSLVVAGTVYRGEFEGRIKQIIDEVKADQNIILFIDELHTIIGAGGASGSLDAANILKPALAKGNLRCIGATTPEEYHKHIESDAALERRFQPIYVTEPTAEETVDVLKGLKQNYEKYHNVRIADSAVRSATDLSIRYLQDKFLPDKAIDLIDEAASKVKIAHTRDDLGRRIRDMEDRLALVTAKKQEAVRKEDFTEAVAMKEEEGQLRQDLAALREQRAKKSEKHLGTITDKDIAEVVSRITGVPLGNLVAHEQVRLLKLEEELHTSIIGQDEAITAIASCIRRSRTGLSHPNRPLGSFIFLGPSGVGKTETAKALARSVFGDPKALLQFDMSEYAESFQASKLIGAPPGYVGYKEGSKLTEGVKRKPYSVVLFDEIEKAHPDMFNLLLQILDEGHLTDAAGKRINFKNTIIIMTSNVGLGDLNRQAAIGFTNQEASSKNAEAYERIQEKVLEDLKRRFRPEFLNRVDKVLVFKPLSREHIDRIIDLRLQELKERAAQQGLTLKFDRTAKKLLAAQGTNPEQGARQLQHLIQEKLENPLAEFLLKRQHTSRSLILAVQKGEIVIRPT